MELLHTHLLCIDGAMSCNKVLNFSLLCVLEKTLVGNECKYRYITLITVTK